MKIERRKLITVIGTAILGGTGTASARSDRADERLEEHFGDGRHPGRGRGKGNAHGPDIEDSDDLKEYTLTVSVVDAETGEPIEGAIVQGIGDRDAYGGDKLFAVTTGPDGTGTTVAQPGEYLTDVDADGYERLGDFYVTIDGDTSLSFELEPSQ